ncbi:unnamed protein product [Effrenium voratum]|nr:unnamed protein product [Effrenium voratum]CAJ1440716.1 unnamed protein product [Effrenium voratum]
MAGTLKAAGSGTLEDGSRRKDAEQALQRLKCEVPREECLGACQLLESTSLRSRTCQQRLLELSAPEVLVATMKTHLADAELQIVLCRILQHLASLSNASARNLEAAGACRAFKAAIEAHPSQAAVHQAACQALELVALGAQEDQNVSSGLGGLGSFETLASAAVQDGLVETLIGSLKRFRADGHVQQACLAALQALQSGQSGQSGQSSGSVSEAVAKAGGIAAIIGALADHRDNAQLQYWGQVVLAALCHDNLELRADAQRKCHWQKIEQLALAFGG